MTKITIGVYKSFKNSGKRRSKTKKPWCHYFMSDDYTDELAFGTEWVDSITAQFLKLKKWHLRKFLCLVCGGISSAYVKNNKTKVICPYCED